VSPLPGWIGSDWPSPSEWHDPRDPQPWPFADDIEYFMSGTNQRGPFVAMVERYSNPGCAVDELNDPLIEDMIAAMIAHPGANPNFEDPDPIASSQVFVDSGAFGEAKPGKNGFTWPHPISDDEWVKRLGRYERFAKALHRRCLLVLPDKVAHQQHTLGRLAAFAEEIARVMEHGPEAMICIQGGPIPMADFWWTALDILRGAGVPNLHLIRPGIPLKKAPTTDTDVAEFVRRAGLYQHSEGLDPTRDKWNGDSSTRMARRDNPAIHFLGRGVYSQDYMATFAAAMEAQKSVLVKERRRVEDAAVDMASIWFPLRISSDSVIVRNLVGSSKKPGLYMTAKKALEAVGVTDARERERLAWHMTMDAIEDRQLIQGLASNSFDTNQPYDSGLEQMQYLDEPESTVEEVLKKKR
jgi:hypothetical protein